ncbi:S-layer homology domain-containing protein [Paenibacillus hexagrammi]|uniref:S-layer homology domain-containing protein n=1 Tax=Paenibacillus hexagrammi TaxID=2908839 RepID=A0ABY3SFF5_9BACL|nr:S-layer homology domain-containing protein [Paenibacillus sp. YPD9-1]UJF32190.1 S-layer homology domain-containing protein [Paenibacillus sp. YPD9-1]
MNKDWTKWLVTTMMLSMAVQPASSLAAEKKDSSAAPGLSFQDFTQISPAKIKAVQEAVSQGLMSGYPDGAFHPDGLLTREELAVVLAKALQLQVNSQVTSSFSDVSDSWGTSYIEAVRKAGLMGGDSNEHFRPSDTVTREELATVFVRALHASDVKGGERDQITDADEVSSWAGQSVDTALRLQLLPKKEGGFAPKEPVQREDIALFLTDIFNHKQQTAVINKIDGDIVTIDGKPYLIDDQMKKLFSSQNKEALEGATITYTSSNRNMNGMTELTISKSGKADQPVTLDVSGKSLSGVLHISGDYVVLKGDSFEQVEVQQGAAHLDVNGKVSKLNVQSTGNVALTGNNTIENMKVSDKNVRITLSQGSMIDKLELPEQVSAPDVITNYEVMNNHVTGGASPSTSTSGSSSGSKKRNHSPEVARELDDLQTTVNFGDLHVDLTDAFSDSDYDQLQLQAVSSDSVVASVYMQGSELTLEPLQEGVTTITVTANDGRGGQAQNSFELQVVPPDYSAPILVGQLPNKRVELNDGNAEIDLNGLFEVMNGDTLTLSAESSQSVVSSVYVNQAQLVVTPLTTGESTITVTATNSQADSNTTTFDVHIVDTTALAQEIADSETLLAGAVVGTDPGNYPQSAVDDFLQAVNEAKGVKSADSSVQQDMVDALSTLQAAAATFHSTKVSDGPFTAELAAGAKLYLNSNLSGTSGDVQIKDSNDVPFYSYGKRNIADLLKVKKNNQDLTFDYQTSSDFDVLDSSNVKVADVTVESDNPLVQVTAGTSGYTIHPLDAVTEATEAHLIFKIKDTHGSESSVSLPITMDETAPSVTDAVYADQSIVITFSEAILATIGGTVSVQFSDTGDFTTGHVDTLNNTTDFIVSINNNKFSIALNSDKWTALQSKLTAFSKFRVSISSYSDYSANPLSISNQEISIGQP